MAGGKINKAKLDKSKLRQKRWWFMSIPSLDKLN
jgi:hypothetical protein